METTPFFLSAPTEISNRGGVLVITGGTFAYLGQDDTYGFSYAGSTRAKASIIGGTYCFNPEETYYSYIAGDFYRVSYDSVPEDYVAIDNGDCTWTVTAAE